MGMLLLFTFVPETSAKFLPSLRMPRTAEGWRYSLLLMTAPDGNELLHGSMALRVELWFYRSARKEGQVEKPSWPAILGKS